MDNDVRKLIEFLAEDCGWPLEDDQIDRSAWPVNNAELGLNDEVAVDSVEIYELRPLTTNQPWGVFFVAVKGTSNLSMSLLRKLLRGLVKKKRASADTSNLQQWNLEDLMFVCSLDEPENTTRYFAHFKEQEKGLPKLMIGARWQDSQPESEIQAAKLKLKSNLKWPDYEADIDSWRDQWGKAFLIGHKEVIKTSSNLASALAKYAVLIKQNIPDIYSIESDNGPVHRLFESFKEALISDLKIDDFADMVAQTITYGLFSARATGSELTGIETLSECIPATNPFLKDLFTELATLSGAEPTDLDFDDLAIDELISMLNQTNIESVMNDFGSQFKGGKEDPVIHFYETFLSEYESEQKMQRGVFYTPKKVVSYIVNSVDERLRLEFGLTDGLADTTTWGEMSQIKPELIILDGIRPETPFVQILDFSTGTGTFIVEIISVIHLTMMKKWASEGRTSVETRSLWNHYVSEHLLPRIFGFEIMMAPYSIAHIKINLFLTQTGYDFNTPSRLNIYLTNTLEPSTTLSKWIPDFLAQETTEVNSIKETTRFTVVIGNPPYSNFGQLNQNSHIMDLLNDYKKDLSEKKINLNDDFIKFFKFSQKTIEDTGVGVIGLITNNVYLDGLTHRRMRESLLNTFNSIKIIDLHGNITAKEKTPSGELDGNVFEIKQGVCIAILCKSDSIKTVDFNELFGKGEEKTSSLADSSGQFHKNFVTLVPGAPNFLFQIDKTSNHPEYNSFIPINVIFSDSAYGIQTKRDSFTICFDKKELIQRSKDLVSLDTEHVREKYGVGVDGPSWSLKWAKEDLTRLTNIEDAITNILYRPFDKRWTIHTDRSKGFLGRPRWGKMNVMRHKNMGILAMRQVFQGGDYTHIGVSDSIIDERTYYSQRGGTSIFPLWKKIDTKFESNINIHILEQIQRRCRDDISHEHLFSYIICVLSSTFYRNTYIYNLKVEFPRVPLTTNGDLFSELSSIGKKIISLQLMKTEFDSLDCEFIEGTNKRTIGSIRKSKVYSNDSICTDTSNTETASKFTNVPEDVWNFSVGGYQVCNKWLYDRRKTGNREGRVLTDKDILHFRKMVKSIEYTLDLMREIDEVIERHGGWPLEGSDEFEVPVERDEGQTGLFDFK
jgi:predicted helicase